MYTSGNHPVEAKINALYNALDMEKPNLRYFKDATPCTLRGYKSIIIQLERDYGARVAIKATYQRELRKIRDVDEQDNSGIQSLLRTVQGYLAHLDKDKADPVLDAIDDDDNWMFQDSPGDHEPQLLVQVLTGHEAAVPADEPSGRSSPTSKSSSKATSTRATSKARRRPRTHLAKCAYSSRKGKSRTIQKKMFSTTRSIPTSRRRHIRP